MTGKPDDFRPANEARPAHVPGEPGIWLVVLVDMTVFMLVFGAYLLERSAQLPLFRTSQATLDVNIGFLNTLLLLTSSLFVVLAVGAYRQGDARTARRRVSWGLACGAGFLAAKVIEYGAKIRHDLTPATNDFFVYYYVLTGLHLLHVLIGMGVLLLVRGTVTGADPALSRTVLWEGSATYWHMVDLLWVVLFPLVYLLK